MAFEQRVPGIAEDVFPDETPAALVERLAHEKAQHIARALGAETRRVVLGADTVVVLDREILGKPRDPADAAAMLGRLVGRDHRVVTGVALVDTAGATARVFSVESAVSMRPASASEIRDYVAGGEPLDKAGAYAYQGEGRRFVRSVGGSETNVIGLPMAETLDALSQLGLAPPAGEASS